MTSPYTILVLNGPNMRSLGIRQPEIYGSSGLDAIPALVADVLGPEANSKVNLDFDQKNGEGELIDRLEQARRDGVHGIAFNAGAYTHTSLALADCLTWVGIPVVEVHLSNVWARPETIRHQSRIAAQSLGVIAGFGIRSYALAVQALFLHLEAERAKRD